MLVSAIMLIFAMAGFEKPVRPQLFYFGYPLLILETGREAKLMVA